MRERCLEDRLIDAPQQSHHGIGVLRVKPAAEQDRTEHGNEGHGDDRCRQDRERLCERERVEQLAFLPGQREDRYKGEQDDRHRKEDGAADETGGFEDGLPDPLAIARIHAALFNMSECVLGDDDARIHEHADGDGNAGEAHDVRRHAGIVHPEKRQQHRERQRNRDDQDRADVHEEDHMGERHQGDLLDQGMAKRVDGLRDQR